MGRRWARGPLFGLLIGMPFSIGRAASLPVPHPSLSDAELAAGWISLFDGQTLFGWQANSDLNWTVREGAIRADRGKPGLLLTTFQIADFELRCEYRLQRGGNSGLFLRTPFVPTSPARLLRVEYVRLPSGLSDGQHRRPQEGGGKVSRRGEWMTMDVRVEGTRILRPLERHARHRFHRHVGEAATHWIYRSANERRGRRFPQHCA